MAFRLITGAQGSGKTNKIFTELIQSSIDNPDRKHIVITPDQNTLLTERRLLALSPNGVLFNIEVESFDRLAYKIFDELELSMPSPMDEVGKSMLLRKIVHEHSRELSYYESSIDKEGFITKLKTVVSEFLSYGITPEDLSAASEKTASDLLRSKLNDLSLILKAFNEGHTEKNSPREELMSRLLSVIDKSSYFDDAFIVIDAFTGFSPLHYQLIEYIMSRAFLVVATLTISPDINVFGNYESHDLFAITLETAKELQTCAQHCGLKTLHDVCDDYADIERPEELKHLERHYLRAGENAPSDIINPDVINVYHTYYPSDEASFAAETISYLVSEKGYKYRDFAIVSGDLNHSAHDITGAMEEYGIPYFLDCHDDLHNHPLVRFILGALEIIESGFSISSVFSFLRTGLAGVSHDDIDLLENYFIGTGIRGYKKCGSEFTKEFSGYDLNKLNEIRDAVINPLIDFRTAYQVSNTNTEFIDSILKLLEDYNVKINLQKLIIESTDYSSNSADKIFDSVIKVLDEAQEMLTGKRLSAHQLKMTLASGFQELSLGLLPPRLDEVQIGDIRRSRRGYVKVLIFINMNEDILPGGVPAGGILSDRDREELKNNNLILANSCIDNLFREQYYIYELLATPTDKLYLTYSDHFITGADRKPSLYLLRVLGLFNGLKARVHERSLTSRSKICMALGEYLAAGDYENAAKLTKLLEDDPGLVDRIYNVSSYSDCTSLTSELEDSIMKSDTLSISALTTYSDCPYKYFFERTLKLSDRKVYKIESTDRGTYVHSVLENAFLYLKNQNLKDYSLVTNDMISAALKYAFEKADSIALGFDLSDEESGKYLLGRWKKAAETAFCNMCLALKNDLTFKYVPDQFEFKFEDDKVLAQYGIKLKGVIDRIDIATGVSPSPLRVIDYKSSEYNENNRTYFASLENGQKLQLPLYQKIAMDYYNANSKNVVPGKNRYINTSDRYVKSSDSDDLCNQYDKIDKDNIPDFYNSYITAAVDSSIRLTGDILSGNIDKNPLNNNSGQSNACTYCKFKEACYKADFSSDSED